MFNKLKSKKILIMVFKKINSYIKKTNLTFNSEVDLKEKLNMLQEEIKKDDKKIKLIFDYDNKESKVFINLKYNETTLIDKDDLFFNISINK